MESPKVDEAESLSIGGDNHLNVVIANYAPHVRCDRTGPPGPPFQSCLAIVADMIATRDRAVFGVKSRDPRVEVNLPRIYKASKPRSLNFHTAGVRSLVSGRKG